MKKTMEMGVGGNGLDTYILETSLVPDRWIDEIQRSRFGAHEMMSFRLEDGTDRVGDLGWG